ncbi:MAG: hypothetical protein ACFBSD_16680 [Paracoccaceae bacterium]
MAFVDTLSIYDMVGLWGVALYLIAYSGVQIGAIDGNKLGYTCLNGLAAACILFSMIGAFNLAGALVNALFLIFSLVGGLRIFCLHLRDRVRMRREERIAALSGRLEAEMAAE